MEGREKLLKTRMTYIFINSKCGHQLMQCVLFFDDVCMLFRSSKLTMKWSTLKKKNWKKKKKTKSFYFNALHHSAIVLSLRRLCPFFPQCFCLTYACFLFTFLSTGLAKHEMKILILGAGRGRSGPGLAYRDWSNLRVSY